MVSCLYLPLWVVEGSFDCLAIPVDVSIVEAIGNADEVGRKFSPRISVTYQRDLQTIVNYLN